MTDVYRGRIMLEDVQHGEIYHGEIRIEIDGPIVRVALGDDAPLCDDLSTALVQFRTLVLARRAAMGWDSI